MLGSNAIYLAREIGSWGLSTMTEAQKIDTINKNEVIIRSFDNAINDMGTMMYEFMTNDSRSNMYGFKMKFGAIESIAAQLCTCLKYNGNIAFGCCEKDYNRIADDLEVMAKLLNFEIENNMTVTETNNKTYKQMPYEVAV
jgi:hypothetical protein